MFTTTTNRYKIPVLGKAYLRATTNELNKGRFLVKGFKKLLKFAVTKDNEHYITKLIDEITLMKI